MASLKHWVESFRLRTLPLALSTVMAGTMTAYNQGKFNLKVFVGAFVTTLFLQILSNLANDYGDAVSGADDHRIGPKRMVQSGRISRKEMKRMIAIVVLLSFISGIWLIYQAFPDIFSLQWILFFFIGLLAIGAAVNYTIGHSPYGYKGWGDFFVFLFFGMIGVYGTYYLHAKSFHLHALLPAIAVGALSAGVLNVNNMRDEESDRAAHKNSLVVILGHQFGVIYHLILVVVAFFSLTLYTLLADALMYKWIFLITIPLFILHLKKIITEKVLQNLDGELKRLALTTFLTVMLWGIGLNIQ